MLALEGEAEELKTKDLEQPFPDHGDATPAWT